MFDYQDVLVECPKCKQKTLKIVKGDKVLCLNCGFGERYYPGSIWDKRMERYRVTQLAKEALAARSKSGTEKAS